MTDVAKGESLLGVERTISVLEAFIHQNTWGVSDLARYLDIHKAVTYRLVRSLESRGFLEQVEPRGPYTLGPAAVALGRTVASRSLVTVARRHLLRMAEQTGEVVLLYLLRGHRYVCVDRLDVNAKTAVTVEIGDTIGLHAGAGKSILAFQGEGFINEVLSGTLARYSDLTPTDPTEIRETLTQILRQKYWVSEGEITPGTLGISAPVRDVDGQVKYTVCLSLTAENVDQDRLNHLTDVLLDTAASISQGLGFQQSMMLENKVS